MITRLQNTPTFGSSMSLTRVSPDELPDYGPTAPACVIQRRYRMKPRTRIIVLAAAYLCFLVVAAHRVLSAEWILNLMLGSIILIWVSVVYGALWLIVLAIQSRIASSRRQSTRPGEHCEH